MKFVMFLSVALSVFALLTWYIKKRFVDKLDLHKKFKTYLTYFLILNYLGIVLYMYGRYNPIFPSWIYFLLSLPIGILFLSFVLSFIYDISHMIINKSKMSNKRRDFLKKSIDAGSFVVAAPLVVKSVHNALHLVVEEVHIKIKNLNANYSIVQLSDIHIGGIINQKSIEKIVKKVNALKPDLVVITGDLVDIKLQYAQSALEELNHLKSKFGTYFIVGNHEYIHGVDEIIGFIKKLNITILDNKSVYIGDLIDGFNLVGVTDMMGYRLDYKKPDLVEAMKNTKEYRPSILLAHQPRFIHEVTGVDLVLSGHTHGGQIFPFNYLVRLQQPYISGLHQHNKSTQIYVNKGTGFWGPPMRLGTHCEISHIKLS